MNPNSFHLSIKLIILKIIYGFFSSLNIDKIHTKIAAFHCVNRQNNRVSCGSITTRFTYSGEAEASGAWITRTEKKTILNTHVCVMRVCNSKIPIFSILCQVIIIIATFSLFWYNFGICWYRMCFIHYYQGENCFLKDHIFCVEIPYSFLTLTETLILPNVR